MEDELVKQQPVFESDSDEKSTDDSKMKELVDKLTETVSQEDCVEDCVEDCKDEPDTEQCTDSCEMPKYKCIKYVWALKIKSIVFDSDLAAKTGRETDGSATFTPEDECFAPIKLSAEYVHKHKPVEGGYYVVYKDGYKSFSPASAFEEGYVLIS